VKSTTNTECVVLVHTHDRGVDRPSTALDLSPYITAVSVNQSITGGGTAAISLPAVDHVEDLVAAGDLVNIYFNTNRNDENIYNRGRVRTFFGYINSVSKSISVGGDGTRTTTYTISCRDFSKVVRNTEIYNNEHLASQSRGGKRDVVRADLSTNIGGIALLNRGIALQGTPRQIVLQNLSRFLGFGGQWSLPSTYQEKLNDSSWNFTASEDGEAITSLQGVYLKVLQQQDSTVQSDFASALSKLTDEVAAKIKNGEASSVSSLWDEVQPFGNDNSEGLWYLVSSLKAKFKQLKYQLKKSGTSPSHIGNTFFTVSGQTIKRDTTSYLPTDDVIKVSEEEHGLKRDLKDAIDRALNEIAATNPEAVLAALNNFPQASPYAQPYRHDGNNTSVVTMFNILSLDYLEDVGGFWAKHRMMNYQGTLMSALQAAVNPTMNEFFFDLRPAANFKTANEDGLKVPIGGALPMVPAVVLRRKPFTNYKTSEKKMFNQSISGDLVVGGSDGASDQLLINSGGAMGPAGATPLTKDRLGSVKKTLQTLGDKNLVKQIDNLKPIEKNVVTNTLSKTTGNMRCKDLLQADSLASATGIPDLGAKLISKEAELSLDPLDPSLFILSYMDNDGKLVEQKFNKDCWQDWSEVTAWQEKVAELAEKSISSGVNNNKNIVDLYWASMAEGISEKTVTHILMGNKEAGIKVARSALTNVVTLPRPIFRSPDDNRITKELDLSRTQYVLGTVETVPGSDGTPARTSFKAFAARPLAGWGNTVPYESKVSNAYSFGKPSIQQEKAAKTFGTGAPGVILDEGSRVSDLKSYFNGKAKSLAAAAGKSESKDKVEPLDASDIDWHVLDYMAILPEDVNGENYTRGDFNVVNVLEYFGSTIGGFEAERLFLGTLMPIMTPVSIYRFGVRVLSQRTEHVQAMLTGGSDHLHEKNILLRWVVLQDMWNQHNHELLSGNMSLRGMPGLRVGYRVDRPDTNLSFYVETVSHDWTYPGRLSTQIGVSRGQPMTKENALNYERPTPNSPSYASERQNLGKVFKTSEYLKGSQSIVEPPAGSFTGKQGTGRQIKDKFKRRKDDPSKD
jgi:hypothetical protein